MPELDIRTLQRGAPLDPLAIEKALNDLWREYADEVRRAGTVGARARLANLVTFCRSNEEADSAAEQIALLNADRPVRSILIVAEPEAGTPEAAAAIKCGQAGRNPVCYEEVTLHTPGEYTEALPSLVEPLTVTDLPTYLWFPGDPPLDDPRAMRLLGYVERVVTDSHLFRDPLARFQALHRLVEERRGEVVFTEMTWTRLGTWREAVGKLFDPQPSRDFLPKITDVVITSAHGAGEPSDRALLMAGWLASRLKWRPVRLERARGGQPGRALYESAGGNITVTLSEGPTSARGHLLGLEMKAGEVTFRVGRLHQDPAGAIQASIICTGDEEPGPAYRPLHWSVSELLCNALEIRSPFADWEEALGAVAKLEDAEARG